MFYSSHVHRDGFCVKLLKEKMTENKHLDNSDSEIMPQFEHMRRQTDHDVMPHLEPIVRQPESDTMPQLELIRPHDCLPNLESLTLN